MLTPRPIIIATLSATCALHCLTLFAEEAASVRLDIVQDGSAVTVAAGKTPLFEYRAVESPNKPYVRQLFTPGGVQLLRDSPADHKHHHALMFAIAANGVDFWSETKGCGVEKHRETEGLKATETNGLAKAGFAEKLDWLDPKTEKPILNERRQIAAYRAAELPATLLTWRTRLTPAEGRESVKLTGSHYFGLGLRFVTSMDESGEFLYSEEQPGEVVRGSERVTAARWCAYTSQVDGKPVTVAVFDHPKNPRHPAKMFTMRPFAYLGATLNLWKEPMELKAGKTLDVRYGVAAWDGRQDAAVIERVYRKWVALEKE